MSYFTLYRFTTVPERVMLVLGAIGGLGHGVIQPLFIRTFGSLIDSLHNSATTNPADALSDFNGFILILVYLSIAAFVGAYLRTAMFVHVGHSQANEIRKQYLTAMMRQEIGWFDSRRSGELTTHMAK